MIDFESDPRLSEADRAETRSFAERGRPRWLDRYGGAEQPPVGGLRFRGLLRANTLRPTGQSPLTPATLSGGDRQVTGIPECGQSAVLTRSRAVRREHCRMGRRRWRSGMRGPFG